MDGRQLEFHIIGSLGAFRSGALKCLGERIKKEVVIIRIEGYLSAFH